MNIKIWNFGEDILVNEFLFVHIPKTAGSSIRTSLEVLNSNNWKRIQKKIHHDFITDLRKYNTISKNTKIFTVVRNPYTRLISYYFHFHRANEYYNRDGSLTYSLMDFLSIIEEKKPRIITPMIIYDQTEYILEKNGNLLDGKIFRYENLSEVEKFLNIKIPNINVGNYNQFEFHKFFTPEIIKKTKEIYARDFEMLNYSTHLEDSKNIK
jgi:hypothetical protein